MKLERADGLVTLSVEDDGIGMRDPVSLPALETNGKRGLSGMHDRVEALGGRLELTPGVRGGVMVTVSLPAGAPP